MPKKGQERSDLQMDIAYDLAGAMEVYGESTVSDIIVRSGNYYEIVGLFGVEAGVRIQRLSKYVTSDGRTFTRKDDRKLLDIPASHDSFQGRRGGSERWHREEQRNPKE